MGAGTTRDGWGAQEWMYLSLILAMGCFGLASWAVGGAASWSAAKRAESATEAAESAHQRHLATARALPDGTPPMDVITSFRAAAPLETDEDRAELAAALCRHAVTLPGPDAFPFYDEAGGVAACTPEQVAYIVGERGRIASEEAAGKAALAEEKLGEARTHLATAKRDTDLGAIWELDAADRALWDAKEAGAPEKAVASIQKAADRARAPVECRVKTIERKEFAKKILPIFYLDGMDVDIRVHGKCGTSITIEWGLWSGPSVYNFTSKEGWYAMYAGAGFKRVYLRGWERQWWFDL